jgi:hypothetical protein
MAVELLFSEPFSAKIQTRTATTVARARNRSLTDRAQTSAAR